jgi:myosin heavy subunit
VTDELRRRLAEAAAAAPLERESTIRVQRLFRGAFVRSDISAKRDACISITRVFRGHRARSDFRAKARERVEEEGLAVFYYHSSIIQRAFRGFYSRKHYHDYSARKKYIDSIKVKGDLLREQLAKHHASQVSLMERKSVRCFCVRLVVVK